MGNKVGVICDLHLNGSPKSPQYAFLKHATEILKRQSVDAVICLGDITAHGELAGIHAYRELLADFNHYEVAGNSDVRDPVTEKEILTTFCSGELIFGGRKVIGIHTPHECISQEDKKRLQDVCAGDIVFLHHDINSLDEESKLYITRLAEERAVTILHGHLHKRTEHQINHSRVVGVKCLDPDKCIGSFPCVTILDIECDEISVTEHPIEIPAEKIIATSRYFGISCVDNRKDVAYALEHGIARIELRCIDDWTPDWDLLPLIQEWRAKTDGYLSVHMPDIRIKDDKIVGAEQWQQAVEYAIAVKADGLTMHPPRVKKTDIPVGSENWNAILSLYASAVEAVGISARVGIENLHVNKGEVVDEHRGFGYIPEEVCLWIDSIEKLLGACNRIGHVLDVGHARNNGSLAEIFPISRWYEIMGNHTVAYHIHQVVPEDGSYKNHCAIENWFGPMINYASFFYAWDADLLNHVPVFLEVKGHQNYEKSIDALNKILKEHRTS